MSAVVGCDWLDLARIENGGYPRPDYVLPGLMAGSVAALVSPGGTGKSMWALQAGAAVAGGADLLDLSGQGWDGSTGRVVYLSAEDPECPLSMRTEAVLMRQSQGQREMLRERLRIGVLAGRRVNLDDQKWWRWAYKSCAGARLVVVDTLRRFHRREENDGGEMSDLLERLEELCRDLSTTVLFLHHTSKASAWAGNGDAQQASRGSSVLTDNVRWQGNLITMQEKEAQKYGVEPSQRGFFIRFSLSKANYVTPIQDVWYRRHEGGVLLPAQLERPLARKGAGQEVSDETW